MSKQVTIYLSRKLTLNRHGHEPVELAAGRNTVDEDVAAHPFVQHHAVDAGPDNGAELDALRAKLTEMQGERDGLALRANKQAEEIDALRDEVAKQAGELEAAHVAGLTAANRVAELEAAFAQKDADMAALVASMTPPSADTKAKGK